MNRAREFIAIDGERGPAGDARQVRGVENERAEKPHLGFEQAVGVRRFRTLESVGAHELREPLRLVRGRGANWPHLVDDDIMSTLGELPGSLAAREPSANDVYQSAHDAPSSDSVDVGM